MSEKGYRLLQERKSITFILLCLICFGLGFGWCILPAIANNILHSDTYGITPAKYADLNLLMILGALISANLTSEISRFSGTKKTLLYGLGCMSLSLFVLGMTEIAAVRDPYSIFSFFGVSQFFLGLGIGNILTSISAFIALYLKHLTAVGITGVIACVHIGSSICFFLMSKLSTLGWWYYPFFLTVFFMILIFIVIALLPNILNPNIQARDKLSSIFRNVSWRFWAIPLIIVLYAIVEIVYTTWGTVFLYEANDTSVSQANYALSIYWIVVTLSQVAICGLVTFIPFQRIYIILPLFFAASLYGLYFTSSPVLSIFLFSMGGLGNSAFFSLTVNFGELEFRQYAELVSGSIVTGYFLGSGAGSILIGILIKFFDLKNSYGIIGAVGILLFLLVMIMIKTSKKLKVSQSSGKLNL